MAPFAVYAAPLGIITWKSSGYVPMGYKGKIMPVSGATVSTLLMVTDNNTAPNPTSYSVRWYVEGELATTLNGTTPFSFIIPRTGQDTIALRASVPKYNGADIDTFLDLPIVHPDIVIDQVQLPQLVPLFYFFSTTPSNLTVEWDDQPDNVTVRARNPKNPFEFAEATISKKQ